MSIFRKFPWPLLLAVGLCLMAWATKLVLDDMIGELTPFLLFFGAIILATWNGGLGVGVFATLLSALLANYFFLPPIRAFDLSPSGLVQCGVFLVEGFFISLLTSRARAAQSELRRQIERQVALSELSQLALARIDNLDVVFERAVQFCAQNLNVSDVVVWELVRPQSPNSDNYFQAHAVVGSRVKAGDQAPCDAAFARALENSFPMRDDNGRVVGELDSQIGSIDKSWGVLQIGAGSGDDRIWPNEEIEWVRALVSVLGVSVAGHSARAQITQGETRYRSFVEQSSEAIWRFEIDEPIDVSLNHDQILELSWQYGYLAECNDAFARMYGFEKASEMVGMRLWQIMERDDADVPRFSARFLRRRFSR